MTLVHTLMRELLLPDNIIYPSRKSEVQPLSFSIHLLQLSNTRITDFKPSKRRAYRDMWRERALQCIQLDVPIEFVLTFRAISNEEQEDINALLIRKRTFFTATFKLNILSETECLGGYRFFTRDIAQISNLLNYEWRKFWNGYFCDPLKSICTFLHRITPVSQWKDWDTMYEMFEFQMSEAFWEVCEEFDQQFEYTLQIRVQFLAECAHIYAESISRLGSPLDIVVASIDCGKVRMCQRGAHNSNQRSWFNGQKKCYCFIYQTINTPDGFMFALNGPVLKRRHD